MQFSFTEQQQMFAIGAASRAELAEGALERAHSAVSPRDREEMGDAGLLGILLPKTTAAPAAR